MTSFFLFFCSIFVILNALEYEAMLKVPQLIQYYKYPVETHVIETEDGYRLQVFRIPRGRDNRKIEACAYNKKPVVFFMHGLLGTSHEFVANPPTESPAYIFADAGFDVWLGNNRGTIYGSQHKSMTWDQPEFWNYTFYELGLYDVTAQVDYILEQTGKSSLYFVGHSLGTIQMFSHLSEASHEWQRKIRTFYGLGPSAGFVGQIKTLVSDVLESEVIQTLTHLVYNSRKINGAFGPPAAWADNIDVACSLPIINIFCEKALGVLGGDEKIFQMNITRLAVYLSGTSYTSYRNIIHLTQLFGHGHFLKFDHGDRDNEKIYGSSRPPAFNLTNIIAPTVLYMSDDDIMTTSADAKVNIIPKMGPALKKYYYLDHFTHFDYVFGLRANEEVFRPIIFEIYDDLERYGC